jgi:SPP1 family predicted phage head-tail adaptor
MFAGTLDRRIVIQQRTDTRDAGGEPVPTWSTLATVWARVTHLRGTEPFQGQQFNAQRFTVFNIRYRDDVDETMQIVHDGETYDIQGVSEVGRRVGLEITTKVLVTA